MIRPLHSHTRTQRADDPDAAGREARERGYEERDARLRTVLAGMAGFVVLLILGLVLAALLLARLLADDPRARAPFATQPVTPPPPHLLANPRAERMRIEGAARRRLGDADLARASQALVNQGWPDSEAPPPDPAATARAHREALR